MSGRKSDLVTSPPVAASMRMALSTLGCFLPVTQPLTAGCVTPAISARAFWEPAKDSALEIWS